MKGALLLIGGVFLAKVHVVGQALPQPPTEGHCVARLGELVAETEGWGNPESLVRRQHNPGGLRAKSGEYLTFLTDKEGWDKLRALIGRLRAWHWSWLRIVRGWSEVPDQYEAAIAPRFRSCLGMDQELKTNLKALAFP